MTVVFTVNRYVNNRSNASAGDCFNVEASHQFFIADTDFQVINFRNDTLTAYFMNVLNAIAVNRQTVSFLKADADRGERRRFQP